MPDCSQLEFELHLRRLGIRSSGYRAFLALTCVLAKEHGYAYPTQAWLADALACSVATISNYCQRAIQDGHLRIVRTGRSSEYHPQLEALALAGKSRDQIRKASSSLIRRDSTLDAGVARATASAATPPPPKPEAPISSRERSLFRSLPAGDEAWRIFHRPWMQGSPELARAALRRVLTYDAQHQPVMNTPGLLIRVFKGLLEERESEKLRAIEEAARQAIGEYKRPERRAAPPSPTDLRVRLRHQVEPEAQKVAGADEVLSFLKKRYDTGDPPDAETS